MPRRFALGDDIVGKVVVFVAVRYYRGMNYKAVVFDLDGTLVDTLADLAMSVNQALEKLSLPMHSVESYKMKVGDGALTMAFRALPADRQELAEEVVRMQKEYYAAHFADCSRPYSGVEQMLGELKEAGLKLALSPNKPDGFTQRVVDKLLGTGCFDVVRGHVDGVELKPDPASALAVCEELGVSVGEVAYVGDTAVDMQTAQAAGFLAIGVSWGFRERSELVENGAAAVIDQPGQLLGLLGLSGG